MEQTQQEQLISAEHRDRILKQAKEDIRLAEEKGLINDIPIKLKSGNTSSLEKVIKTQEQADFLMKQLMEYGFGK